MPNMMPAILYVQRHSVIQAIPGVLMMEGLMLRHSHLIAASTVMVGTFLLGVGLDRAVGVAFPLAEVLDWVVALDEV